MIIKRNALEKLIRDDFRGNRSRAAMAFHVSPQYVHKFLKQPNARAGADLLGGLANYCFIHRINFWDFILTRH